MTFWEWFLVAIGVWLVVAFVVSLLIGAALGKHWLDGDFE